MARFTRAVAINALRRLALCVPTLVAITLLAYFIIHRTPGERETRRVTPSRPSTSELLAAYGDWAAAALQMDLGVSWTDGRAVTDKLAEAFPKTMLLAGLALLMTVIGSVAAALLGARAPGGRVDRALSLTFQVPPAVPMFVLALALQSVFAAGHPFRVFPLVGLGSVPPADGAWAQLADVLWHAALPTVVLATPAVAWLGQHIRVAVGEALAQDYVRTARAKGLPARTVLVRHALPSVWPSVVAMLGLLVPALLGGSVVIERAFNIRGMGSLVVESLFSRDHALAMGVTSVAALISVVASAVADISASMFVHGKNDGDVL